VENEPVLARRSRCRGEGCARRAGVEIDDAVEHARVQVHERVRSKLESLRDIWILLEQWHRLLARDPCNSGVRMNLAKGWQERGRSKHVAHRVELHDENTLFDPLIVVARAENARPFVKDARPIAAEEPAVERDLASAHAPLRCRVSTRPDVERPGMRSTM